MLKIEGKKDQSFSFEYKPKTQVWRAWKKDPDRKGKFLFIPPTTKKSYAQFIQKMV